MIPDPILEAVHARLASALAAPQGPLLPLVVGGRAVGWLNPARAERVARCDAVFRIDKGALRFAPALRSESARTEALADVTRTLAQEGLLSAWRNETYAAGDSLVDTPAFLIERAAARYFGILTHAAHLNGLVAHHGQLAMWLARRSATKPIDPGLLDNLVGGGVRFGSTVQETLQREAWEEAGIPGSLVQRARPVGAVRICREQPDGIQREIVFAYDLRLPGDYTPIGVDGEAVAHRLATLDEAAAMIGETAGEDMVTADASLVIVDCLLRHGALAPDAHSFLPLAALRWPPIEPAAA